MDLYGSRYGPHVHALHTTLLFSTKGRRVEMGVRVLLWARSPVHRLPTCEESRQHLFAGRLLRIKLAHDEERM